MNDKTEYRLPRAKVRRDASFIADVAHGLGSNLYMIAPLECFKGRGKKQTIRDAEASEAQSSSSGYAGAGSEPGYIAAYFPKAMAKADLVEVTGWTISGGGFYVDVAGTDDVMARFNRRYWEALSAAADCALLDRNKQAPAVFLKDDTVIALLMPVVFNHGPYSKTLEAPDD